MRRANSQLSKVGDIGGAVRWAALAHLADQLAGHPGGGGAQTVLTLGLGLKQDAIDLLDAVAGVALTRVAGDVLDPRGLPEMCLTEAIDHQKGACFVEAARSATHPVSSAFLRRALVWALDEPKDPNSKGQRLEWLTAYLAGTLSGARARKGFNSLGFACEHDVVVTKSHGPALPGGSTAMLIECKNWKDPLGAAHVGYFLGRMKYVGAGLGVLVAKSGITEDPADDDEKNARAFLVGFCQRENVACLVVNRADLERIATDVSFLQLLDAKYEEFTFGRKKSYA
jgi:hypothetical protein